MKPSSTTARAARAAIAIVVTVVAMTLAVASRAGFAGALVGLGVALLMVAIPVGFLVAAQRRQAVARAAVRRPRHCTCCGPESLHRLEAVDTTVDQPTVVHS